MIKRSRKKRTPSLYCDIHVETPMGAMTASSRNDSDYPGIQISINGIPVAAVEVDTVMHQHHYIPQVLIWQKVKDDNAEPIKTVLDFSEPEDN